ncbi:hypothetical protein BCS96_10430 [Vibrio breoganii]|uniref:glycosyltransferase family 2 protein n=1 Tax=Vibrio breoganii TaxID=553239 RepID=UPI000C84F8D1|nr:glycosyltransferase family 2 protein [Vibrio breoganii]PML38998.1 hypothetical protein BCT78_04755 [Vibrio breoganii]PMO99205.1 hypothetical protein BCS96_10430 [Vibrio breoganii]
MICDNDLEFKLTIIIPTFKSNVGLKRLLASIPTFKRVQVIVIDDDPNCSAKFVATEYPDVEYVVNEQLNRGAGAARNLGLSYAVGDFILFADSDDFFTQELNNILEDIGDRYFDSFDIVFFPPVASLSNSDAYSNRAEHYINLWDSHDKKPSDMIKLQWYVPWSKLIKRDLIVKNNIKFDEVMYSNDINFSLKVGIFANTLHCDFRTIYNVVESNDSLTKDISPFSICTRIDAVERYNNILILNGMDNYKLVPYYQIKKAFASCSIKAIFRVFKFIAKNKLIIDYRLINKIKIKQQ